jgi:hypothetical protein
MTALRSVSLVGRAAELAEYLRRCRLEVRDDPDADVVLVVGPDRVGESAEDRLLAAGTPVLLVGPTTSTALSDAAGLVPRELSVMAAATRSTREGGAWVDLRAA